MMTVASLAAASWRAGDGDAKRRDATVATIVTVYVVVDFKQPLLANARSFGNYYHCLPDIARNVAHFNAAAAAAAVASSSTSLAAAAAAPAAAVDAFILAYDSGAMRRGAARRCQRPTDTSW